VTSSSATTEGGVITSHFDLLRATQNPTDLAAARSTIAVADPSLIEGFDSPAVRKITVCVAPHGMAMTQPTGSPLFVACYGEDKIAVVDLETEGVEYVDVGPGVTGFGSPAYGPYALLLLQGEPTLVVSSTASKDVRFIDTATLEVDLARTVTTLGRSLFPDRLGPMGPSCSSRPSSPTRCSSSTWQGSSRPSRDRFSDDECDLPHAIERVGDGYSLVCEGDKIEAGKVVVLDAALEIVSSTVVGVYPDAIVNVTGVGQ
jgi:hypothetical protein